MAVDGLISGIDSKITFNDVNGVQKFVILENFTSKEDAVILKEISIDGVPRHPKLHQGWSGSFTLQRTNDVMDRYIALQEAAYYQGIDQVPMTITQTITEVNGSVSQYQYTGVVIALEDAGNYSGTEIVKQRVTFMARRKELVV